MFFLTFESLLAKDKIDELDCSIKDPINFIPCFSSSLTWLLWIDVFPKPASIKASSHLFFSSSDVNFSFNSFPISSKRDSFSGSFQFLDVQLDNYNSLTLSFLELSMYSFFFEYFRLPD